MDKQFLWETFQKKRRELEAINKDEAAAFFSSNDLILVLDNKSNAMTVDSIQLQFLANLWPD